MSFRAYAYLVSVSVLGFYLLLNEILNFRLDFDQFGLALLFLSLFAFFAEIYELLIIPKWALTTGIVMTISAIYIGGASLAIWVIFLSTLPAEFILRWDRLKEYGLGNYLAYVFFNTGQLIISVSLASLAFQSLGAQIPPYNSIQAFITLFLTFLVYEVSNVSLVSAGMSLITERKFAYILRYSLKYFYVHFLTLSVIAILISIIYYSEPWNLIIAFIPLGLAHISMRNYLRLRKNSHTAFSHIADLLAERDRYTGEHSNEVEEWSEKLAEALNLSEETVENIRMGAAIHDIGKIAVPDAILNKPGPLSEEEWAIMKQHPVVGAEIIGELEIYRDVVPIVRHEHEHWDGGGYPDGLAGENIPVGARVVAVADVYSALTTERAYRPAQGKPLKYTHEEAREIMQEGMAGTVLDPELVKIFFEKVFPEGR